MAPTRTHPTSPRLTNSSFEPHSVAREGMRKALVPRALYARKARSNSTLSSREERLNFCILSKPTSGKKERIDKIQKAAGSTPAGSISHTTVWHASLASERQPLFLCTSLTGSPIRSPIFLHLTNSETDIQCIYILNISR